MKNIRNWVVGIVLVLIVVAIAFIRPPNAEKVNIGVILPLTGGLAGIGADAKVGLEIAQGDAPESRINLIIENDLFTPKESVVAFNKLVSVDDVVAVIGPLNGTSIESVRTLALNNQVSLFTPYGAGNDIGDYVYKNSVEGTAEARVMADKANSLGYKKLAIIYLQNDFGLKYLNSFRTAVLENGGELVAQEAAPLGANDFRTQLAKIKAAKPDALYLVNTSITTAETVKQAVELGMQIPFLSQYATESPDLIRIAGNKAEGMIYTFFINDKTLTDKQERFIAEYKKRTGADPQIVAYNVYDIYSILVQAVDKCQSDKECINNYIRNIKDYDGVSGKFSIVDGKLVRDFYFKQVKDGQFVALD